MIFYMRVLIQIFFLLLLTTTSICSAEIESDTLGKFRIDSTSVFYFRGSIDSLALGKLYHIDTSLNSFHQYDPAFFQYNYYAGKGNIGQHSTSLIFNYLPTEGYKYSQSTLDLYAYDNSQVKYYQLIKPFTDFYYVQGPEKEKILEVLHTQNIKKRLNAGIKFRFLTAPGLYQNQKTDHKNLYLTLRYRTENKRYGFILNYLFNKLENQENGGILDRQIFEENLESDRLLIPVNLYEAKNREVRYSIFFNHYFNIAKHKKPIPDSLIYTDKRTGFRFGRFTHSINFQKNNMSFWDNMNSDDSTFFLRFDPLLNKLLTFDTLSITKLENQIIWSNLDYEEKPQEKSIYFYFGLKSQLINISDTTKEITHNQFIPKAGFSIFAFKSSRLNVDGYYVLNGYNDGDAALSASLVQFLGTQIKNIGLLTFETSFIRKQPDWFYTEYQGNNIRWDNNDYVKENIFYFKSQYHYKTLKFKISYYLFDNFVYLDENAHPLQFNSSVSVVSANLRYKLKIKDWRFDFDMIYQKSSKKFIAVPEFIGSSTVYVTKNIFGNNTLIQPGIEAFYNTSYYAYEYMPAIRSFYYQNNEKIGNKIYAGIFLNFLIKRAMFFLRYQHTNAFFSKAYYMTPSYPMQDAIFRFGLSWKFYD